MADQQSQTHFVAFARMVKTLTENGIDDETQGLILGNLSGKVLETATAGVLETVGSDRLKEIEQLDELVAQESALNQAFQEKRGISIAEYREQVADEMVKEFEATL